MEDYLKYVVTFATGSGFTFLVNYIRGKLQIMECHHMDDEILSKLPMKTQTGVEHKNIYCKTFRLKNTTNVDVVKFKVVFQFDSSSIITESYNKTKTGVNEFKMKKGKQPNECSVIIEQFNRSDYVDFVFNIANVSENSYYIRECECIGFKIKCKDKRKAKSKIKSQRSDVLLTTVSPVSALE